ncbi:unnamed protein product [Arctia plantaginis]|uniref:Uncharacterized protein n=1 Tax=Arctia plantaginis TaxID=874455 RepID=A0A8S1B5C4_ARCPL|nr:unnamed protein product [Arctia plantaginis]
MQLDLMDYIEETHRIGRYSNKNRPLAIELISKRMAKHIKDNNHYFQGTISEFHDENAQKERLQMRDEMLNARRKGMHAVIRNNQLIIEGKRINITNEASKSQPENGKPNYIEPHGSNYTYHEQQHNNSENESYTRKQRYTH